MSRWRSVATVLLPFVLAAACGLLAWLRPVEIRTALDEMIGPAAASIPDALRHQSSGLVPVVVSAPEAATARSAADNLFAHVPTNACRSVRYRLDALDLEALVADFGVPCGCLASAEDCLRLATPEGRTKIARRHLRRLTFDPTPTLFPVTRDAFGLTEGFVRSFIRDGSGWSPRDGVLTVETNGLSHVLMVLDLKREVLDDLDRLIAFEDELSAVIDETGGENVRVAVCGVPIHTAATARACRREIAWLSLVSFLFVIGLSLAVFRSVRWLFWILFTLLVCALSGGAALLIFFPSVHLMTLVFGTTLLGLVIDYSFHWLLQEEGARAKVVRGLTVSWLTTETSLLPLFFSSLPVLRQSAAFLGAGLAAALAVVLFLYPRGVALRSAAPGSGDRGPLAAPWRAVSVVAIVALMLGVCRTRVGTSPLALYRPTPALAEAERFLAQTGGASSGDRGFLVVGRACLREKVKLLHDEQGEAHAAALGYDALPPPEGETADGTVALPLETPPTDPLPAGVEFHQPAQIFRQALRTWTSETCRCLLLSLVLMLLLLERLCHGRAVRLLLPSVIGLAAVAGCLGWTGEAVNLFHLLASFLLIGMGLDYAVFLHGGGRSAIRPATCSLLTSLVGFGLLAFVSFPVVRAFGVTLGVGLPVAYLTALLTRPADRQATEHAASPLGLEILWAFYRLCGLRFLHFFASAVGVCSWLSSRAVRRASPRLRKIVLFTRSLADKLVVMAQGRRLPRVVTDGSPDAQAFVEDVGCGRGVFVLCSHVGTIEVLAALGSCHPVFHAWMEFDRTAVFNRFYLRHAKRPRVVIHPISQFGPSTVFEAGDALDAGDCLLMAADRTFGRVRREKVGDRVFELAEGAFRFAAALEHPVYFVACLADGSCSYRAVVRRLTGTPRELAAKYAALLDELTRTYPDQWFVWGAGHPA